MQSDHSGAILQCACITYKLFAGDKPPQTAFDKNGLKIVIHFGKARPRPDVEVMVVSVMSSKTSAVSNFKFQAAVPKVSHLPYTKTFRFHSVSQGFDGCVQVMKVKLQPASATDLPPFNPILPSAAITQVMLVANPQNVSPPSHSRLFRSKISSLSTSVTVC